MSIAPHLSDFYSSLQEYIQEQHFEREAACIDVMIGFMSLADHTGTVTAPMAQLTTAAGRSTMEVMCALRQMQNRGIIQASRQNTSWIVQILGYDALLLIPHGPPTLAVI